MRPLVAFLAAVFSVASAPPARADFPADLSGLWVAGSCSEPEALLFLTRTSWVRLDPRGMQTLKHAERFGRAGAFELAVANDAAASRLLLRTTPEELLVRDPPAKLLDAALPGDGPDLRFRRCSTIPIVLAALHGEGLSFVAALDEIGGACSGDDARACLDRVWGWADVSADGALSVAELARLGRGLAYVAALSDGATVEELGEALGAASVAGVAAAWGLLASLDYDGSGTISRDELARDRFPPPGLAGLPAPAVTAAAARPGGAAALSGGLGALGAMLKDLAPLFGRGQR